MITRTPFRESMCSQYKWQETECTFTFIIHFLWELRLLLCTKYVHHQATSARKRGGSRGHKGHAPSLPEPLKPCYQYNCLILVSWVSQVKPWSQWLKLRVALWTIILHMLTSAPLNPDIFLRLWRAMVMQPTINRSLHIKHLSATWFSIPYLLLPLGLRNLSCQK